jgi:hypothetical protein
VPVRLERLISSLLERRAQNRPATAAEVIVELRGIGDDLDQEATAAMAVDAATVEAAAAKRGRRRRWWPFSE